MKPQPKHQPLFFTPRTPWGTRLPGRSFFDHLKASDSVPVSDQDKQPDLLPKELRRLGVPQNLPGQDYLDRRGVPQSLSGQTTPGRIKEIQDESLKLPPYSAPRLEVPDSASSPKPAYASPAAAGSGVLAPALTHEERQQQQMERWGGPDNTYQVPKRDLLKNPLHFRGVEITPDLDSIRKGGAGFNGSFPLEKKK